MVFWYKFLVLMLIAIFIGCFIRLKNNGYVYTPIFAFVIGIAYFILFPFSVLTFIEKFSLNPLSGATGYWASVDLNNSYFMYPFFIIWISLLLCGVSILLFTPKLSLDKKQHFVIDEKSYKKIVFIIIASMAWLTMDWTLKFIQFGGISEYLNLHWYMRNDILFNEYGSLFVYLTKFTQANMVIFTGMSVLYTLILFSKEMNKRGKLFLSIFIFLFHILIIFLTGNRIYFAIFLLLTFSGFIIFNYRKQIVISVSLLPVLLIIFSAWSYTRSMLHDLDTALQNYFASFSDLSDSFVSMLFDITEGANVLVAFHIINDYGNIYEYLHGATYSRVLTSFIPDLSNKIDSFTVIIGSNYMPGTNVSLNSTIIGELYANFGLLLILILPILAVFLILLSQRLNMRVAPIVTCVIGVLICWFVRSVFSDNFLLSIITVFIIIFELMLYDALVKISNSGKTK
ncbi:O-antigen polymerase [Bacillus wiedmannii]|uniref:O-antigen polymerase n=1 Tax=Bacillus wiedmannii TaxID=1890302 RepID=UPI00027A95B6|nr:O-antigen polymerase [Bacillus wiedmannii]EJS74034.1 hypothetical protein ICW_00290 [Bacillus wiedmannii]PEA43369.1 oligosaccharide repeat unit polymerase [Bacillus wiedmannii]